MDINMKRIFTLNFIFVTSAAIPILDIWDTNSDPECILPPYPAHGSYVVSGHPNSAPGEAFDSVAFNLTCDPGYQILGKKERFCVDGVWSEDVGTCVRYCRLLQDPSINYSCLNIVNDVIVSSRPCTDCEPHGTIVHAECRSPINSTNLPNMHCIDGNWDYIPRCPKIKPGCNVTIVFKDRYTVKKETVGEMYVSEIDSSNTDTTQNDEPENQIVIPQYLEIPYLYIPQVPNLSNIPVQWYPIPYVTQVSDVDTIFNTQNAKLTSVKPPLVSDMQPDSQNAPVPLQKLSLVSDMSPDSVIPKSDTALRMESEENAPGSIYSEAVVTSQSINIISNNTSTNSTPSTSLFTSLSEATTPAPVLVHNETTPSITNASSDVTPVSEVTSPILVTSVYEVTTPNPVLMNNEITSSVTNLPSSVTPVSEVTTSPFVTPVSEVATHVTNVTEDTKVSQTETQPGEDSNVNNTDWRFTDDVNSPIYK